MTTLSRHTDHPSLRHARFTALIAMLLAFLLAGTGCEPKPREESGWVPTSDGPVWVGYVVRGDYVTWDDDVMFDYEKLLAYQATVRRGRPLEVVSYDIDNGSLAADDTYVGGTGDPSRHSNAALYYGTPHTEKLAGGIGKLADGEWAGHELDHQDRRIYSVDWMSFQPAPLVFHFDEPVELGSVVIHGGQMIDVTVEAGGQSVTRTFSTEGTSNTLTLDEGLGLGFVDDEVTITLHNAGALIQEVEFFGMKPDLPFDPTPVPQASINAGAGWPGGRVPFSTVGYAACPLDGSTCPMTELQTAIDHWHDRTGYEFTPDPTALPRVEFTVCTSRKQSENCERALSRNACIVHGSGRPSDRWADEDRVLAVSLPVDCGAGTIIHELGHVAGLYHEQSRRDRARYIDLNETNIMDGFEDQFAPKGRLFGEYNLRSIMHYRQTSRGRTACCSEPDADTSQDGLPDGCEWFEDVAFPYEDDDYCPSSIIGAELELPWPTRMKTISPKRPFPIVDSSLIVGQHVELSKGDITAAHALAFGDLSARSYLDKFDVSIVDFAPEAEYHAIGDVNADGYDDVIALGNDIIVGLGQPDGSIVDDGVWYSNAYCSGENHCLVGDLDGDGADDVAMVSELGTVRVLWSWDTHLYPFIGAEVSHYSFGLPASIRTDFFIADVDGDCDDDIVAVDYDTWLSPEFTVRVAYSGGGKLTAADTIDHDYFTFDGFGDWGRGMSFGDVDRDGKDDLQMGRGILLSTGSAFEAPEAWAPSGYFPGGWCTSECVLHDVDGDDRLDLVETNSTRRMHQDRIRYALSNGWAFATGVPNYHELDCRNQEEACLLGDVDGDGRMDVVDAVGRFRSGGPRQRDHSPGDLWISRAMKVWTEDIGTRKNSGLAGLALRAGCFDEPLPDPF